MLTNRSAPHARITPVLIVSDVRAAVAWYAAAFGFVEHVRIGDGHRAQLGLPGGGEIIVAEPRPGREPPGAIRLHQIMLKVEDAQATVAHIAAAGGATVEELQAVWTGQATPQQALDRAATRGNEVLRQYEKLNAGR